MTSWDIYQAELADTAEVTYYSRPLRPCHYCSMPTRALSQVCCAHTDLIELDYGYPAVLEAAGVPSGAAPGAPPASAASSAAESEPCTEPEAGVGPASGTTSGSSGLVALA